MRLISKARHQVLGILAAAVPAICCLPAQADVGFTGVFDPANTYPPDPAAWSLTQDIGGSTSPLSNDCSYYGESNSIGCLDSEFASSGDVFIGGAQAPGNDYTTIWQWTNTTNQNYYVSFSYELIGSISLDDQTAFFNVGDFESGTIDTLNPSGYVGLKLVAPTETITFNVVIPTGANAAGLQITGFEYAVPAPLPAAGAATAFGYSRRLRRRIKGQRRSGSCPPVLPPHPSLYLNLAPAAVQSLPVSFSYASLPGAAAAQNPAA